MGRLYKNKKKATKIATITVAFLTAIVLLCLAPVSVLATTDNDEDGEYVIIYYIDSRGEIAYQLRYQKTSDKHLLDLTNLDLHINTISDSVSYNIRFTSEVSMESDVRSALIKNGFATIISPELASSEEIEAEEYAKSRSLGIWSSSEKSHTENAENNQTTFQNTYEKINEFWDFVLRVWENKWVKWVTTSLLSFTAIVGYINYYRKRRKVMLFFGGEKGAGKTTLKKALMNPDSHEDDLKNQVPTKFDSKERWVRDDAQRKIVIVSSMIDIPGDDKYHAINYLSSRTHKAFRKSILVIVVAPTMANTTQSKTLDYGYISEQRSAISNLWVAIIKAQKTKVSEVILFINKVDLCDADTLELQFAPHRKLLEDACGSSGIRFKCVVGSSVTRRGFQTIMDEIKRR